MTAKIKRILILCLLLLSAVSVAASVLAGVRWQDLSDESVGLWNSAAADDESVVVRAYFDDPGLVDELMVFTEPWEVHRDKGYVVLGVTRSEIAILRAMGFRRIEIDQQLTQQVFGLRPVDPDQQDGIPGFPCYRTVEETQQTAAALAANNPAIAQLLDGGDSWEKTQNAANGFDMQVLVLTNQATTGPKPKLFITSAIHAREYATAELVTRFAEYLVSSYGVDPDITWLLDSHEIHLMLQTNPDGRKYAETGLLWRKNTDNNYCSNTNSRGADLNRNFAYQWGCCGGSSGSECSDTFRGSSPGSEPEAQAVQNYLRAIFPDQKGPNPTDPAPADATGVYIDVHSYSELVLWPWGFTYAVSPNSAALQTLGRKLALSNGYAPKQAVDLYITDGTTDDFAYGDLGVAAYTFELGSTFFQDCSTFDNVIYPDNLPALIYAAKVARTPYQTPSGPDSLNAAVSTGLVSAGTAVTLTADLDDTRFNNSNGAEPVQNIAAVEYYVDEPFWITTTTPLAYPMAPVDGSFDSPVESATAQVDTAGWAGGRHLLYVRGQDALGNWGAVSAVFLYVTTGNEGAFVGRLTDSLTAQPITGSVSADAIGVATQTDASGVYTLTLPAGTWTLRAGSPYHADSSVSNVTVSDGSNTSQDFVLDPTPGMALDADLVFSSQALGQVVTKTLRVNNPGNLPLNFTVSERDGGFLPAVRIASMSANFSVLLVDDDDNSPDMRPYYTTALDTLGVSYTVYNVGGGAGNGPSAVVMGGYDVVVWFSGDQFGSGTDEAGPNAYDEGQLTTYLGSGGALFLSAQDYHYDMGLTTFMSSLLGVAAVNDDAGNYSSVSGQNDFAGYGPYSLTEPGTDYADALTAGSGSVAFLGNNTNVAGVYTAGTVFFAFQWEGIANASSANGAESLQAILDYLVPPEILWLGTSPLAGTVPANSYLDLSLVFSATAPYVTQDGLYTGTLTIRGDDPGNPNDLVNVRMLVGASGTGSIQGTILLQGRTDHSGVVVTVLQSGVPVDTRITNSAGGYTFNLLPGSYDMQAEMDGYLDAAKSTVTVTSGGVTDPGGLLLPGGDVNDDDVIDMLDVSTMRSLYGLSCSDGGYDPLADTNQDCVINLQDISIAGGNFGRTSPVPW